MARRSYCRPREVTVRLTITLLNAQLGGLYFPGRVKIVKEYGQSQSHTHERMTIAIGE